jgi:REP element-mobilizing transposase RayT
VTLCTIQRQELFGQIVGDGSNALMELNDVGRIVDECWRAIPEHFPHTRLDQTQIMPDHLHAIIALAPPVNTGSTQWVDATGASNDDRAMDDVSSRPRGPVPGSLGAIIAAFKSETTKRINRLNGITGQRLWQPGYHERAIRQHGGEYGRIAHYIAENPANWR